jgi:CelD/BcsL family acetyltransferase involved in cellulose biosynthesis
MHRSGTVISQKVSIMVQIREREDNLKLVQRPYTRGLRSARGYTAPLHAFTKTLLKTVDQPQVEQSAAAPEALLALRVEVRAISACSDILAQWQDLCSRAAEANGFHCPAFLLAGVQHLPSPAIPAAILIWEEGETATARLMGLFPWLGDRSGFTRNFGARELKGYASPFHNLGVPHIDATRATDVLETLMDWLARDMNGPTAISWADIPVEGAFAAALRKVAARGRHDLSLQGVAPRAILQQATTAQTTIDDGLISKNRREFARLERKLSGRGTVRYHEAQGSDLRNALEMFLALEASGWKGRNGTALLQTARTSSFIRCALRGVAQGLEHDDVASASTARVISLTLDGNAIAAGLVYEQGGRAWLAKITFDETYASTSPGILLVRAFSRRQIMRPDIVLTDSCAHPSSTFMNDIWPQRMLVGNLTIGVAPGRTPALLAVKARQDIRRRLREMLKRSYHALRGTAK